jgi:hypothetical protein
VDEMREQGRALEFNNPNWGMAEFDLPEQKIGDTTPIASDTLERLTLQAETHSVSAIQPAYDLDRLTLAHERRGLGDFGLTLAAIAERVVLYIPDSDGCYSEESSIAYDAPVVKTTTVIFRLEKFSHQFPLRFDPCQGAGLVSISSITVLDLLNNCVVLKLDGRDTNKLVISGTALWENPALSWINRWKQVFFSSNKSSGQPPLRVISTGSDPQLIFPTLPKDIGFPLEISVQMKFIPSGLLDLLK